MINIFQKTICRTGVEKIVKMPGRWCILPLRRDTEDIEQALIQTWADEPWAMACETVTYRPGDLKKMWPAIMQPVGRVHFAGAYTDNLNWGQEAATRSANRVVDNIDAA